MNLVKDINNYIDNQRIDSKTKESMKGYILQLFNTEKLAPKTTVEEFVNNIMDMFKNPNATEDQKKGYLEYIINCIYKEAKEKKC